VSCVRKFLAALSCFKGAYEHMYIATAQDKIELVSRNRRIKGPLWALVKAVCSLILQRKACEAATRSLIRQALKRRAHSRERARDNRARGHNAIPN
jgi:hypothetical protein